jgi:hypothetical protein
MPPGVPHHVHADENRGRQQNCGASYEYAFMSSSLGFIERRYRGGVGGY